jgi:hypothetical protein
MKKSLLFMLFFALFISFEAMSQPCGRVSLIGEFNGWAGDQFMTRNPESPELFTTIINLNAASDPDGNGIVELKFRANADWGTNWGSTEFPTGTATLNGPNIPVTPIGSYKVTFNCSTGAYTFTTTCGEVGMIGEFNGWAGDQWMTRDEANPDSWTGVVIFTAASDPDGNGIVEMKFRQNADWGVNWGSSEFPSGTATANGPNIPVPLGSYVVTFNCATGAYTFTLTCGNIALIGEFNGWAADEWMNRNMASPDNWTKLLTLTPDMDTDGNGIVEMKFRMNSDWGFNWGSTEFPSGTGTANGPNIPVPLDGTGLTTDYWVAFNCATGAYSFTAASGAISMIGAFNGWNGDVPMNRDAVNPNLWKLSRVWFADSEVKFRENKDWSANWGNNTFPTGTGTDNGPNIPLVAGSYDVTFNAATLEYAFVTNPNLCGEIGMIGDFNTWGDDGSGVPTDVWMYRDPVYPSNYSMLYNFTSSTNLWFRLNADVTYTDVWGGTFPAATGVKGGDYIQVPGGKYIVNYNCQSNDFEFIRLGNGVTADKVFAIAVDGKLDDTDWKINNVISQLVDGEVPAAGDLNQAYFGVAYNDTYLFVGISVTDANLRPGEQGEVFIDGNKSGGVYDANDLHMKFSGAGIQVIQGPAGITPILGFDLSSGTGFSAEVAIPWADLGVTPEEGGQIGFDILLGDDDEGTGVNYTLAWNGGLQDYENTSSFGDLIFGTLSCGSITLFGENIGDVVLNNPTDAPTSYVGTYELLENQNMMFRKDYSSTVTWATDAFPAGTAVLNGPAIPGTTGRYRIAFDCLTGAFTFTNEPAGAGVAYSEYTDTPAAIDGNLQEYNLQYNSEVLAAGANVNNTVVWGSRWDNHSLYLGVQVTDAVVEGAGNPWDNDAVEYYIDGNHDSDGTYDGEFDTQLIQDFLANSTADTSLWIKADGIQLSDWDAKWLSTGSGYNVELRLGWAQFGFLPGKGRSLGFSLGNNDSDNGIGRDNQTVWYGDGNNWSNTAVLGDLQLAGGPYYFNVGEIVDYSNEIVMFPNPAADNVYLRVTSEVFNGNVTVRISDLAGRSIVNGKYSVDGTGSLIQFDASLFTPGVYIVNILGDDNNVTAVKKLIVR